MQALENEFKVTLIDYEGSKRVILAKQPILEERHKNISKEQLLENAIPSEKPKQEDVMIGGICPKCGQVSSVGTKFCSNCGTEIVKKEFCVNCGAELISDAKFCPKCGYKR